MRRKRTRYSQGESENFWPAFTDMISTIAIILFFLMLLVYIQNIITGKNLEFMKKQLEDSQLQLEASKLEISQAQDNLRLLNIELEQTMAEVKAGQIALKMSQDKIDKQTEIIANSNSELGNLRQQLEGIAVLRLNVLTKVKTSIEETMGSQNSAGEDLVMINDSGNIVINESLVFDTDSYQIKPEGKKLLQMLANAFEDVLSDPSIRNNIDTINIQGHTDERGAGEYNRDLGAKRATAVVNYMMMSNRTLESQYGKYFAASSYSEYRPVSQGTTSQDYAKNRRMEISITLKDDQVQNVINEYLEDSMQYIKELEETMRDVVEENAN